MGRCPFLENRVNVCDVKIEVKRMIGDVSWGVGYRCEKFGLISLGESYEGWNFNSGNYLFTTDTKEIHVSKFYCPSI